MTDLIKNYFRIALRVLVRQKGYSALNIAGLAVGTSCFLLVLLMVADEFSYDRFHDGADRIFRVRVDARIGEKEYHTARSSGPMAPALMASVPGVEAAARIRVVGDRTIKYEDRAFTEYRFYLADSTIFNVFSFSTVEGNPGTFLRQPNTVVITEEAAHKYFGSLPALGKILTVDGAVPVTVCGVVKSFPRQSHWHFDFLAAKSTWVSGDEPDWVGNSWHTYVRLKEGVSAAQAEEAFAAVAKEPLLSRLHQVLRADTRGSGWEKFYYRLVFQPITDIHLYSHLDEELEPTGMISTVTMFSIVAVFVLLIACINFMNLGTARATHRAKEVGVRKILGSQRSQLVQMFLSEAFLFSCLALLLSLVIVELVLPPFNAFTGKGLSLETIGVPRLVGGALLIAIIVGGLAGTVPALVLSSFQPAQVLKGEMRTGMKGGRLRGILVVVQFATSIALMVGTVTVYRQLEFIRLRDLGFDKKGLLVVDNTWLLGAKSESFKQVMLSKPEVTEAAFAQNLPGNDISSGVYRAEGWDRSHLVMIRQLWAEPGYLSTLGVKLSEGRFLSKEFGTDSSDGAVINESAARLLGYDHPVGKKVIGYFGDRERALTIVGVSKDFHYEPLHQPILPMVIMVSRGYPTRLVLRVRGDVRGVVDAIQHEWNTFSGGQPFTWFFLDERLDRYYRSDEALGTLFGILSSLGIFLSCLGLLGLTMYATERRRKEMGVRKILGASSASLSVLLAKEFVKLVIIAAVIAWPAAYIGMRWWLESFAYRIDQSPADFLAASLASLFIAIATVAYHTRKVAVANPVESLRYE